MLSRCLHACFCAFVRVSVTLCSCEQRTWRGGVSRCWRHYKSCRRVLLPGNIAFGASALYTPYAFIETSAAHHTKQGGNSRSNLDVKYVHDEKFVGFFARRVPLYDPSEVYSCTCLAPKSRQCGETLQCSVSGFWVVGWTCGTNLYHQRIIPRISLFQFKFEVKTGNVFGLSAALKILTSFICKVRRDAEDTDA